MGRSKAIVRQNKAIVRQNWLSNATCAVGLCYQTRTFRNGPPITDVFGLVGVVDPCYAPVTARCQWMIDGQLLPYYWMACDNPEHRLNAGIIWHYDARGRMIHEERIVPLDTPLPSLKPKTAKRMKARNT